jgi:hypothetical protein
MPSTVKACSIAPLRDACRCTSRVFVDLAVSRCLLVAAVVCAIVLASASSAAASAPTWTLTSLMAPTYLHPHTTGGGTIMLTLENTGDVTADGSTSPIKISAALPVGLGVSAAAVEGVLIEKFNPLGRTGHFFNNFPPMSCEAATLTCSFSGSVAPGNYLVMVIGLNTGAEGSAAGSATASGGVSLAGGEPFSSGTSKVPLTVSSERAPYGIQPSSLILGFSDANGGLATTAGGHPYALTVSFVLNDATKENIPSESAKDVIVDLPPGVAANELAEPPCPGSQLPSDQCPLASMVGTIMNQLDEGPALIHRAALMNLQPENGHTNELGFFDFGLSVRLLSSVRTDSDYGIRSATLNLPSTFNGGFIGTEVHVWGTPPDPSHDFQRFRSPFEEPDHPDGQPSGAPATPFFTMPTSCGPPLTFKIYTDSWQHPGRVKPDGSPDLTDSNWKVYTKTDPAMAGCEALQSFTPSLTIAPDTSFADTPAGLTAELTVPQGSGLADQHTLATPDLRNTTVRLPQGLVVNPGQASGLSACEMDQSGVGTLNAPSCPASSAVGSDEITTPLLPDKLVGKVYVLQSNPPELKLLVAASADDVNVKLVGDVRLDPVTGQLTTTFSGTPALPFTDFKMSFNGGAHAALITPSACGTYTTSSDLTPWSSPFTPDALGSSAFAITAGPGGSACASPLPFSPSMAAGSSTDQAGGFTDFSLLLNREDGQQRLASLQFKTPAGLLGMISKVALCGEPQASKGECPAASQIGHTVVEAGPGPYPLVVPQPGQPPAPIYLTGGYKGAPYGLSIKVPLVVGPFTLQTQIVRSKIEVDPHTAQITVTTDPIPSIIDGIPSDVRTINAVIDRPEFMFNPTNCRPQSFSGTATSNEGATSPIASRFQVGSCQSLQFKPDFKVSTSGKTSKQNGASLDAKVVYPPVPPGSNQATSQANISYVKVALPKQLPSRLTTLQKACLAATFNANPGNCPAASVVGIARTSTPVLPVPLTGPAYFVSHGGEAFPNLVIVLQGYGVRVDLIGDTFISKAGVTSTTFKQVPDVPISSFELYLPAGKYSALAANANLCKSKLTMPATFTAQNGAVSKQNTKIAVTGCAKAKKATKARKARKVRRASYRHAVRGRGRP